jgi:hypothetical protein
MRAEPDPACPPTYPVPLDIQLLALRPARPQAASSLWRQALERCRQALRLLTGRDDAAG